MGLYIEKLKQILRRRKKDPAYDLSAEWVWEQMKRPLKIEPVYDQEKLMPNQINAVWRVGCKTPLVRDVFVRCMKLARKRGKKDGMIERAVALCCADACFKTTGIHVKFVAHFY